MRNRNTDNDGQTVQRLKHKCMIFQNDKPNIILFRNDYEDTYKEMDISLSKDEQQSLKDKNHPKKDVAVTSKRVLRHRSAPEKDTISFNFNYTTFKMTAAYSQPLCISIVKKADLLKTCNQQIIPSELHSWYQNLPDAAKKDYLPESDVDDDQRRIPCCKTRKRNV